MHKKMISVIYEKKTISKIMIKMKLTKLITKICLEDVLIILRFSPLEGECLQGIQWVEALRQLTHGS